MMFTSSFCNTSDRLLKYASDKMRIVIYENNINARKPPIMSKNEIFENISVLGWY